MGCTHGKGTTYKDKAAKFDKFAEFENRYSTFHFEELHFFKIIIPENECLTKENYQLIFTQLAKCKKLLHFEMVMGKALFRLAVERGNGFDDSIAFKIAELIRSNPYLEHFSLVVGNKNLMTGFGLDQISQALKTLDNIFEVRLHVGKENLIGNDSLINFMKNINEKNASKMISLRLKVTDDTKITRDLNTQLFECLSKMKGLKSLGLELDTSIFNENLMQQFVASQQYLEKLTYFQYHFTIHQSKKQIESIIKTFSALKNLEYFEFYLPFEGISAEEVKQLIKNNMSKVQYLEVVNKIPPTKQSSEKS